MKERIAIVAQGILYGVALALFVAGFFAPGAIAVIIMAPLAFTALAMYIFRWKPILMQCLDGDREWP